MADVFSDEEVEGSVTLSEYIEDIEAAELVREHVPMDDLGILLLFLCLFIIGLRCE